MPENNSLVSRQGNGRWGEVGLSTFFLMLIVNLFFCCRGYNIASLSCKLFRFRFRRIWRFPQLKAGSVLLRLSTIPLITLLNCLLGRQEIGGKSEIAKINSRYLLILQVDSSIVFQVNLKFEVRRGSSVRKLLVEEAKLFGATTSLLVGTSSANYTFRSSASVVNYCARKLPKCISVFAVDNGKIIFHREANNHRGIIEKLIYIHNSFEGRLFSNTIRRFRLQTKL